MNQLGFPVLSVILFLPLLGALILALFFRSQRPATAKAWALAVMGVNFLVSLMLLVGWLPVGVMQFVEDVPWVPELGISYHLGVDGISLFLVLLTTLLMPLVVLGGWRSISKNVRGFLVFLLLLETGVLGVFMSLDLVLFYVFWEAMLIPVYFLIGLWGGERRRYATMKFFIYTMAGSALMLVGILYLASLSFAAGTGFTFNLMTLSHLNLDATTQFWLFLAFGLAFAVKAPLFPFHTWLPDAYGEAPIVVTAILAGVLSKMGIYGFLRFCLPLFPSAVSTFAPIIGVLALIGIIYGSLVALAQTDAKMLVAYSSLAHISLIILGIFVLNMQTLQGVLIQVVSHGLNIAILFLLLGMLYERRGTLAMAEMGGLWKLMPAFGIFLLIAMLASVGLPGLNGFVGEFLILVGVFRTNITYAAFATLTVVLGAWYMFSMYRQIMQGQPAEKAEKPQKGRAAAARPVAEVPVTTVVTTDLSLREALALVPIILLIIAIGVFPDLVLNRTESSAARLLRTTQAGPVILSDSK